MAAPGPSGPTRPGGTHAGAVRAVRLVSGLLAGMVVTALAAQTAVGLARHATTEELALDASVTRVVVTGDVGDVNGRRAGAGERARVSQRVSWAFWQPTTSRRIVDGVAYLQSQCPSFPRSLSCSVDVGLVLPAGAALEAGSGTGDISVTGLDGQVTARTGTGDVSCSGMLSPRIQVRSSTGDVTVETVSRDGVVDAETDVGDVRVGATSPISSIRAVTATGDVTVEVPDGGVGYAVDARTDTGDRRVEVPTDPAATRSIVAHSDVGDVRVVSR